MGNAIPKINKSSANVILPDGTIHEYYDKSMTVAELMLEHPQQVVVEFHPSATSSSGGGPLPADNKLEMNKVYLMLPIKRGKPAALSSKEARRLLMTANSIFKSKQAVVLSYTGFIPMFAKMCTVDNQLAAAVQKRGMKRMKKEEALYVEKGSEEDIYGFGESSEFMNRQLSGKKWKPSLDTINEKSGVKKKIKLNMQLNFLC